MEIPIGAKYRIKQSVLDNGKGLRYANEYMSKLRIKIIEGIEENVLTIVVKDNISGDAIRLYHPSTEMTKYGDDGKEGWWYHKNQIERISDLIDAEEV